MNPAEMHEFPEVAWPARSRRATTPATVSRRRPSAAQRSIRSDAKIRGDRVEIEDPVELSQETELHRNTRVGRYSCLKENSILYENSEVGRFCSVGRNVQIGLPELPTSFLSTHPFQFRAGEFASDPGYQGIRRVPFDVSARRAIVGHDVWIGTNAVIRQGVNVGHGAIIGAASVVTRYVPPYAIVAGNPARILRYRFPADIIAALVALEWWNRPLEQLQDLPFADIARCIKILREMPARLDPASAA